MARELFEQALAAARAFHAVMPEVQAFQAWPDDITWAGREGSPVPGAALVATDPGPVTATGPAAAETRALQQAISALAPHAEWRLTYTEEEVGADFLQRFGWFELVGPDGHFHSRQTRMTIGYWGPGLYYPWHEHEPEELYCILSGGGLFEAEAEAPMRLTSGATRLHKSLQPHALTTEDQPILCFVLWRGEGLADDPRMSA